MPIVYRLKRKGQEEEGEEILQLLNEIEEEILTQGTEEVKEEEVKNRVVALRSC